MKDTVTYEAINKAAERLKGKIVRTPLLKSEHLNKHLNTNLYLTNEYIKPHILCETT